VSARPLKLAQESAADELLTNDPFALLVGMLLDQQFPMERAFAGPYLIASRMGTPSRLDPSAVAAADPEEFRALMTGPPAVHRYPGSMGERVQKLAALVVETYDGDAERLWTEASSGAELLGRLQSLPGFGRQKAQIFVALLGKQRAVRPEGWREAAGPYGDDDSRRSVADVRDPVTLGEVRAFKQEAKAAARAAKGS
jgi:uncharacterized HhH-GPD family protein